MESFNLSKLFKTTDSMFTETPPHVVYRERDVKEFIKLLKEDITESQLGWEGHPPEDARISKEVNEKIDKLAGSKLI